MDIHPTAIVSTKSKLADNIKIGPYAIIGDNVTIDAGTVIGARCVVEGYTTIGKKCYIYTGAVVGSPPQDLKYKGQKSFLEIGDNNIIREYVTINPATDEGNKTVIGNNNLLMAYSHVAHDCRLHDGIIIANVGTLAGFVTVEDKAVIGGLAAIHQFTRVGQHAIIGGCSKVVQDVPPYSLCDGHPCGVRGLNMVGLKRAGFSQHTKKCLKQAFKILFKSGMSVSHALKDVKKEVEITPEVSYLIDFVNNSQRGVCR